MMLRAAGSVGLATLLSRILGLVREQVIAFLFGAGDATDAFNVAFRIPNLLRNLFAEGAMSASLVPVFTRTRIEEGDERAWRVAGLVFRVLLSFGAILTVFGMFFARELVRGYASAYQAIPGKLELTIRMTQWMFPYFPLVVLAAAFMGILNSCGKFFLPALSSAFFNLASIATGVIFAQLISHGHDFGVGAWLGVQLQPIEGMAAGVIVGGLAQAFCQLPLLYRAGYRFPARSSSENQFPRWYKDPALRRMLFMMAPGIAGLAATQLSVLINTILATAQGPGAVSWLNYAFRLMQFPIGIFGASFATAALPEISRCWVNRDLRGVNDTLASALRHVFAINLPASAGLAFLGYPIIELIFQHGRFQASDTRATALALAMYSVGLTAYSAVKVLVPACYAMGNTRTPVILSAITIGATLALNLLLVHWMGFSGLALGTSLGALLNFALLMGAVRKLMIKEGGVFAFAEVFVSFAKNFSLAVLMGSAVYVSGLGLEFVLPGSGLGLRLFRVSALIFEGMVLTLLLAQVFGLQETGTAIKIFADKFKSKLFDAAG